MSVSTLVLGPDTETTAAWAAQLQTGDGAAFSGPLPGLLPLATGHPDAAAALVARYEPRLLVYAPHSLDEARWLQIESLAAQYPALRLVLVSSDVSREVLIRAMRSGVAEVLPHEERSGGEPAQSVESGEPGRSEGSGGFGGFGQLLRQACERQLARVGSEQATPRFVKRGEVIAFIAAKGGSGATFLAANLAYALGEQDRRVALIDLNLPFGDASLLLGTELATRDLSDLSADLDRLDAPLLESSMLAVGERLRVLPAPRDPQTAAAISVEAMPRILGLARSSYEFVILDTGRGMDPAALQGLDEADAIHLVAQPTIPALHEARRMLQLFDSLGYAQAKLRVVINRMERRSGIDRKEIESVLGHSVYRTIPNDYPSALRSVNDGVPIVEQAPREPIARALLEWARDLAPPAPGQRRPGWLRSFVGRAA